MKLKKNLKTHMYNTIADHVLKHKFTFFFK